MVADMVKRVLRIGIEADYFLTDSWFTKVKALRLSWPLPSEIDDSTLEKLFYSGGCPIQTSKCPSTNWVEVHLELKKKGITKQLLWEEHVQKNQDCYYSYSRFCYHYSVWKQKQQRSMRQVHKAGNKLFVDYASQTFLSYVLQLEK